MPDENFAAMRQSIIDGAPNTASSLAQQPVSSGIPPTDTINHGYVLGMYDVGEQFARGQMFLPDMMASAEAMRAAMAILDLELKKLGAERPMAGVVVLGTTKGRHPRNWKNIRRNVADRARFPRTRSASRN